MRSNLDFCYRKQVSAIKQREVETNERVDDIKHLEAQLENERSKLVEKGQVEVKKVST